MGLYQALRTAKKDKSLMVIYSGNQIYGVIPSSSRNKDGAACGL